MTMSRYEPLMRKALFILSLMLVAGAWRNKSLASAVLGTFMMAVLYVPFTASFSPSPKQRYATFAVLLILYSIVF